MEKLGYTDTETLLWDYSETEVYYILAVPPARARKILYQVTEKYAFQWYGLNRGNNLRIIHYPFSRINFTNLTNPCDCPPEEDAFTATVSVNPPSVTEGDGIPLIFTISLDRISGFDTTIFFTLTGTSIETADYTEVTPHSVTILASALTAQISVEPFTDLLFEDTETVTMTLTAGVSGPGLINVSGATATGEIIESLAPPLAAWQRQLSVAPDAPIWHHVRADSSSTFNNGVWLASAAGVAACDIYWDNVVLLMGYEGANGSTGAPGMTDESVKLRGTGTAAGTAAISTTQAKFGTTALATNGANGTVLTFPDNADFDIGAGLFTIECFFYPNTIRSTQNFLCGQWFAGPNLGYILHFNGSGAGNGLGWNVSTTGSDNLADMSGGTVVSGSWQHACAEFDGVKYRLYLDGVMVSSFSTPRTIKNSPLAFSIGSNSGASTFGFDGWIDELRFTKGVARYASDSGFVVPTERYPRSRCFAPLLPFGWERALSTVAPTVTRDRRQPPWADASSYAGVWLSPAHDCPITYIGTTEVAAIANVATFTSVSIGTATADRLVVVALSGVRATINARTLSSFTINGNAATIDIQVGNNLGLEAPCLAIVQLPVAAGATANMVATYSGALTTVTASVYTITGLSSNTPVATGSNAVASGDPSTTLNVTGPGGIAVAMWAGSSGATAGATFTGVTEDYDAVVSVLTQSQFAVGHQCNLASETPRTFSATSTMTAETIVAATWGPPATSVVSFGWAGRLFTVASPVPSARTADASYANDWLTRPAVVVTIVKFGWHQPLSTVLPSVKHARTADSSYANDWLRAPIVIPPPSFGWHQPLSAVAPSVGGARRALTSSYNNSWLSPVPASVTVARGTPLDMGGAAPRIRRTYYSSYGNNNWLSDARIPVRGTPINAGGAAPRVRNVYYQSRFGVIVLPEEETVFSPSVFSATVFDTT